MSSPAEQKSFHFRLPIEGSDEKFKDRLKNEMTTWIPAMDQIQVSPSKLYENRFFGMGSAAAFDAENLYYKTILALVAGVDPAMSSQEITQDVFISKGPKSADFERFALMACWMVCQHLKNEFVRLLVVDVFTQGTSITGTKLLLLDRPDSDVWSDDERLALKFVKAAFEYEMTDELFEAGVQAWGPQWILNSLELLVHYQGYDLRMSAVGLDRHIGLKGDIPVREQTGWANAKERLG